MTVRGRRAKGGGDYEPCSVGLETTKIASTFAGADTTTNASGRDLQHAGG